MHISKVRSVTLDTWLPEQVAFMQNTGNVKANQHWEGDLPSGFRRPKENDRSGLEKFIRAKYDEKRWVSSGDQSPQVDDRRRRSSQGERRSSREGISRIRVTDDEKDERVSRVGRGSGEREDGHRERAVHGSDHGDGARSTHSSTQHDDGAVNSTIRPLPSSVSSARSQVGSSAASVGRPSVKERSNLTVPALQGPQGSTAAPSRPPPKAEAEVDLFDLLSSNDEVASVPDGNHSGADDVSWATFQSAESGPASSAATSEKLTPARTGVMAGSGLEAESNGKALNSSVGDDVSWATFQSAASAPTTAAEKATPTGTVVPPVRSGQRAESGVIAGLEELFTRPLEVSETPSVQPDSSKDVKQQPVLSKQNILSLFETPNSRSQGTVPPEAKFSAPVPGLVAMPAFYLQGNQQQQMSNDVASNLTMSSLGVAGQAPQHGGILHPAGFPNGGLAPRQNSSPIPAYGQAKPISASLFNANGPAPASVYGAQGRVGPLDSGLFSDDHRGAQTYQPSNAAASLTPQGHYDFSSLTAGAFTKL